MIHLEIPAQELAQRLKNIRCILLDWDGVFNDGFKYGEGSPFSETDSMGINLLRYFFFITNNHFPFTAVISGEKNPSAFHFATREHFHACYFKIKDKKMAIHDIRKRYSISDNETIFFFDDVLDLPIARVAGIRVYIHHPSRRHFLEFLKKEKLCDIYSDSGGGNHGVREVCEHLIACSGQMEKICISRENYDLEYDRYSEHRKKIPTDFFTMDADNQIKPQEIKS